eukprot:gene7780-12254_t
MLSNRSEEFLNYEMKYLSKYIEKCIPDLYSQENPKGFINLGVSENILSSRKLLKKIKIDETMPLLTTRYGDVTGDIKNMFITDGCGPTIDLLSHLLFDIDDIVLIPEPCYAALNVDFGRSKVNIVGVDKDDISSFQEAYQKFEKKVKCVFLVNPNNPTGQIYTEKNLEEIFKWCDEKNIHVVVDQIYALSVFKKNSFVCASSFYGKISEKFDSMLHIFWGISKDFGLSGFRLAMLYTENKEMMRRCMPICLMYCSSALVRHALINIFSDEKFFLEYIDSNQKALYNQYLVLEEFLIGYKIEYVKPEAAFFVWVNLKKYMEYFKDDEISFWERVLDESKVNISCGKYFHAKFESKEKGWYRICFPCVEKDILVLALSRLKKFFDSVELV